MTGDAIEEPPVDDGVLLQDWSIRPWLLAIIGAFAGLAIFEAMDAFDGEPWRAAIAAFAFFGAAAAGFVLNPKRLSASLVFAVIVGLVMASIAYISVNAAESRAGQEFAFSAGVFFSLLAIPLFQAGFHRKRWATPYAETHFHVWTDAVSAGGAFLFMGLSWALLWLLHGLFSLIGIDVIEELIETGWFSAMFAGATFGAALGVLRNQLGIIGTLQRVVMLVFSLLAVPFAAALLIFLVILLFSGGSALWEATDSATPVLLSCAVAAFILTNAIIRDDDAQRSGNAVMQASALALAFCILPLTIFAAISMGIRIDQHGLAPARIWALIAIVIATAYGLAYWAGLARGRLAHWAHYLRRANLHLAVVTCAIALILALPLMDFGAVSTRDQLARLASGDVAAEEFDYAALKWDFGDAGREALAELTESDDAQIAQLAQDTQALESRPYGRRTVADRRMVSESIEFGEMDEAAENAVQAYVRDEIYFCDDGCRAEALTETDRGLLVGLVSIGGSWQSRLLLVEPGSEKAIKQNIRDGQLFDETSSDRNRRDSADEIELRPFNGQQLYIDGEPASSPFE